ncbi:dTDP-4-dehydrorhamnose 3,5-epimerase family protein [Nocardiopsis sp. CC223A]|uniref:dTDP-4-dehydrorhamnose 3,5-epimerase family protein n=1 Tax=Nocardiopsis sp. CC223A TaxID=3044051 RepID=UPI00278C1950|nr:dTDP-4-dehydrorhamnose 3,5-epimerase family protein [Nocardiopsis sp. CC223A]
MAVSGAYEFTPESFHDERGVFVSPFQREAFEETIGVSAIPVKQTNHSKSRRGVLRGVHFTSLPPGSPKYVFCPSGRAIDFVVDLRLGSETFGQWDSVLLDQEDYRSVYLPVGVGHAFVSLEDDTLISYMLTASYVPEYEVGVSFFDPRLALPLPKGIEPVVSERDRNAMNLDEAQKAGILPDYEEALEAERLILGQAELLESRSEGK